MWKDLSFKNRSELMSLFLKQGISSLSDMINIYNGVQDTEQVVSRGRIYDGEQDTINRHNNPVLLKYAGTTYDPVIADAEFIAGTPQETADYLHSKNITENKEVIDYFHDYVNSEGYKRIEQNQSEWWKQRHPYKKFIDLGDHKLGTRKLKDLVNKSIDHNSIRAFNYDTYSNLSFFSPSTGNAYIGNKEIVTNYPNVTYLFDPISVAGHEVAHKYNNHPDVTSGGQGEALLYKTKPSITGQTISDTQHDNYPNELHSDIWGLKYLLYKEGIYDSRSNKDITIEEVKQLREKYPNLRPLMQSTDEELVWRLNHIASLDNQIDFNNLVAFGGNLNNQYSGLGNTNMPVLPFLPRIISRLKTNKQSKVEQSNMDNYISYFDATPELIAQANLSKGLMGRDRIYNIDTKGPYGDTHFDVVSRRTRGLYNAMKTKNFSDEEIMRLLPLVVSQNVLEGGYKLSRDDNNFGGMMHPITGKRLTFKSEEDFYLNYLDNLDKKWGDDYLGKGKGWRNAKTLKEYADIVNREDLRLHTKDAHTNYNLEHANHPAYLYTPLWENNNTTLDSDSKLGGIYPRVLKMMELLNNRISEWNDFAKTNNILKN